MNADLETKLRAAVEKAKPLLDTVIADLEREATLIKERDLDPRKLAEEPRVQEARSAAVEALEHLSAFAKSLDSLLKGYASELDKRVDVGAVKEQIVAAPGAARSKLEQSNGAAVADRIKSSGDEAKERVETAAQAGREHVETAAHTAKEQAEAAARKGKDSTAEMLAALGWATAAAAVIYMVFMDEKRREQTKKVAKAAGSGLMAAVNSAGKQS